MEGVNSVFFVYILLSTRIPSHSGPERMIMENDKNLFWNGLNIQKKSSTSRKIDHKIWENPPHLFVASPKITN